MDRNLIDLFAGDDRTVVLTVLQPGTASPQNIAGWASFDLYVKWNMWDPDTAAAYVAAGSVVNAALGQVQFNLIGTDTIKAKGSAHYIVRAVDGVGKTTTVATGPYVGRVA